MNEMLVLEKNGEENLILDYYAYIYINIWCRWINSGCQTEPGLEEVF